MVPLVVITLLALAALLLVASARFRRESERKLGGRVVYSDLIAPGHVLASRVHGIVGKPDYILKRGDLLIPVEVKSTPPPEKPYRSHELQLAAYCLLIEENFGVRVPYGYIEYAGGRRFRVDFDDRLRAELAMIIHDIREAIETGNVKAEPNPRKCASCSVRSACSLVSE